MKAVRTCLLLVAAALAPAPALALPEMEALTDEAMDHVSGQAGIAFNWEFRVNSQANGEVIDSTECPTVGSLTNGASCRFAFTLPDLTGAWVVMKNYRGINKLNNIRLDAVNLPAVNSGLQSTTYLGAYSVLSKPAMQISAGGWATAYAAGGATYASYLNSATYNDFVTSMYAPRISAEFDSGGTPGYLRDAISGSPLGLRIASGIGLVPDPNNPPDVMLGPYTNTPAGVRLDGQVQIHGFGQGF